MDVTFLRRMRGYGRKSREKDRRREGGEGQPPKGLADITYDPVKTPPDAIAKIVTEKTGFKAAVPSKDKK